MIVNSLENGWEIIFQRNHALLAGAIAQEIQHKYRPPYWIEMLSAILEHDDGQTDWNENSHITDAGRPLDFTLFELNLAQAERVVKEAKHKSRWITLLVSMHVTALYGNLQNKSVELERFLKDQVQLQKELRRSFSVKKETMENYYSFLRWCDECSLILCQNRLRNIEQKMEIGSLYNEKTNYIQHLGDHIVQVTPWCFESNNFKVSAEVYRLEKLKFASTKELKSNIEATQPDIRCWEFRKSNIE